MSGRKIFIASIMMLAMALIIVIPAFAGGAQEGPKVAEAFPSKPITAIAPFGAGGGTDRSVRAMALVWGNHSEVPMRVVNMPGAGSAEGMRFVLRSDPDGYTIVQNGSQMLTLPYFYAKEEIGWALEDFIPIAVQQVIPYMLVVPANSPFNTLQELVAYAKANPGKLTHGVVGFGGDSHVAFRALELEAGFSMTVVPFDSGADQVANIAGGHIDAAVATFGTMLPLATAGTAKVLATSMLERSPKLPNAPTAKEQGVNWTFPNWRGWLAPPKTPKDRVEYLAKVMREAMNDKALIDQIVNNGEEPLFLGPEEFTKYLEEAHRIMGPAIKSILAEQ